MDYNYLVFLYFATIITPSIVLVGFYAHIYRVVLKQLRQIVTMNPVNIGNGSSRAAATTGNGTMLRMLGAAQKREVKATQNLSVIVLFFMLCWIPLYTINCVQAFCPSCTVNETFMKICIILSHLNSAGNPILYAYHLKDFRAALKSFICSIIGLQVAPNPADLQTCRPSIASNLYFNQYNNSINQRRQSFRESRSAVTLSQQNKLYSESPVMFSNRLSKSVNLPTPPKVSSIVNNAATVVALTAKTDRCGRDIFKITEASFSEHDTSVHGDSECQQGAINPCLRRSLSASSVNVHAKDDGAVSGSADQDDDEVFTNNLTHNDSSSVASFVLPSLDQAKVYPFTCLSCSSPQLSRSRLLVEENISGDGDIGGGDTAGNGNQTSVAGSGNSVAFLKSSSDIDHHHQQQQQQLQQESANANNKTAAPDLSSLRAVEDFLLTHSSSLKRKQNDISDIRNVNFTPQKHDNKC